MKIPQDFIISILLGLTQMPIDEGEAVDNRFLPSVFI